MAKLRDDLIGVVYVDGVAFGAGAELPDGVGVSEALLAVEAKVEREEKAPAKRGGSRRGR